MTAAIVDEKKPVIDKDVIIEEVQLGLWQLKVGHSATLSARRYLEYLHSALPLFKRLFTDIYYLSPSLFSLYILCQLWSGVEDAILMHLSNSLLYRVEQALVTGKPDTHNILLFLLLRFVCSIFVAYMQWNAQITLSLLRSRVTSHFNLYLMKAKLGIDLPTSQEAASTPEGSASDAFDALEQILRFMTELLTTSSQLALIIFMARNTGGPMFSLLCISRPIVSALFAKDLWSKVSFGFVDNKHHQRLRALEAFAGGIYREDIIANNLRGWIIQEYEKSHKALGNYVDSPPYYTYGQRNSPSYDMLVKALGDLPTMYCALCVIMNPARFSIASIAILQQSSMTLRYSLEAIFQASEQFKRSVNSIRKLYEAPKVANVLTEGNIPYPPPLAEKTDDRASKGMAFELRNISFSYPGSQKNANALSDVSLSIMPGQLVVLVGPNGCGKSTMVRMLSRLYDPTFGEILIDGRPSHDYLVEDLHRATAVLSQDNNLYPLTLGENIGLGFPECSSDSAMIKEAAQQGGALEFIEKLKRGLHTSLESHVETFSYNLYGNKTHPLYEEFDKMDKNINISGGERQRVVAARCFMRFKSGCVRFVAVDEPSSALDAEGELQLFNRLIEARAGKTMVFVTHRFGHLTKYADMIICMKDGSIAEIGTHDALMTKQGEYSKLYNIQANAFSDQNGASDPVIPDQSLVNI